MTLETINDTITTNLVMHLAIMETQRDAASIMKIHAEEGRINTAIAYIDITEKELEAALAMVKTIKYLAGKRHDYA
jgi:hypothetical protein